MKKIIYFLKKAWIWVKKYWYISVIVILILFAALSIPNNKNPYLKYLEDAKDSYDREIKDLKKKTKIHKDKETTIIEKHEEKVQEIIEQHEEKENNIEEEYKEKLSNLENEKENKINSQSSIEEITNSINQSLGLK